MKYEDKTNQLSISNATLLPSGTMYILIMMSSPPEDTTDISVTSY